MVDNKITKEDREEILQKEKNIIQSLRNDFNVWDKQKLSDYILRYAEVVKLEIEYGILSITDDQISTHIFKQFIKENIPISDRRIREALPANYKRNYNQSAGNAELHDESVWTIISDDTDLIEKDQFDNFRINGKIQQDKPEPKGVTEEWNSTDEEKSDRITDKDFLNHKSTEFFLRVRENAKKIAELSQDICLKYFEKDPENGELKIREGILEAVKSLNIDKLIEEQKEIDVKLIHIEKKLDWRERIGPYEKIMAKYFMMTTKSINQVANLLHCSTKHLKNDVLREDIEKDLEPFIECPKCHEPIADEINSVIYSARAKEEREQRERQERMEKVFL